MTNIDPDLHHAISLRPSPFHANPPPASATLNNSQYLPLQEPPRTVAKAPATSSAYETSDTADPARQRPTFQRNSSEHDDVERGNSLPAYDASNDPYNLSSGIKTDEQLETIKANTGKRRTIGNPKKAVHARRLQGFYEAQNENIERLLKPVNEHVCLLRTLLGGLSLVSGCDILTCDQVRQAKEEQGADALQYKIAVTGSFVANILLAILQIYGAVSSGSLSLFTTMADAIFDPCSNLTLILANRAINRVDARRFPSGKARIETAGNITFCFLMTAVSLILIVQAIIQLVKQEHDGGFHLPSVVAVAVAFTTKLGLFAYCWALQNKYSQIRILWEDHRNDLFINGFGLLTSIGGSKLRFVHLCLLLTELAGCTYADEGFRWWIDPMGAIILSCLISFLWTRTAYSEFQLLIGVSADTPFLQHITYICKLSPRPPHCRPLDI